MTVHVFDGNNPGTHPAFEHGASYARPGPAIDLTPDQSALKSAVASVGGWLVENHNLIASNARENELAKRDILASLQP